MDTIRAELPAAIRERGKLVIGLGALPSGYPPLAYTGDDQKTLTGSEPDLGRLIAAVFGLTPDVQNATWENLFVGIDSGRTDVGLSNITDTEQRKLKYDFASYRQDNVGFEVLASSSWNFAGDYENLAGKTVSVSAGTNQEKILLEWQKKLQGEGRTLTVQATTPTRTRSTWPWTPGRSTRTSAPTPASPTTSRRTRRRPTRPATRAPTPGPAPPCRA